ncbi:MAG: MoxR family ATPase [Candidatus Brocadiia bacterium]
MPDLSAGELKAIESLREARKDILTEIHKTIVGQDAVIEEMMISVFCRGHCLMVGVPGLAKTLMVRTLGQILDLEFKRIQFTPDLMPSDITGTEILDIDPETSKRSFKFVQGPIFSNILLADEINRTPPKTQAALLEAMQEYRVTVAGQTYHIPAPFFVLATQNPIEQEGTYPLPEAQLDRFMFSIFVDYPSRPEEIQIVESTTIEHAGKPEKRLTAQDIISIQQIVRRLPVSRHVIAYATDLARATRPKTIEAPKFIKDWINWGAGPRAAQYLILGAKARAIFDGRVNVSCNDVRTCAAPVLRHRMFTNFNADSEGISIEEVIKKLLETVKEPDEKEYK